MSSQESTLRAAFLVGAITDALALVPLLVPSVTELLWGFEDLSAPYRFAMGYAASLMLAWTVLLVWAYRRPIERRGVAAITLLGIAGLVVTEVMAVASGGVSAWRMIPTWCLQAVLAALFGAGFFCRRGSADNER